MQAWLGHEAAVQLIIHPLCRVYRVAHGADIIPYLPPKMLQYEDVGPEIFITSTGRVLFNQKVSHVLLCYAREQCCVILSKLCV